MPNKKAKGKYWYLVSYQGLVINTHNYLVGHTEISLENKWGLDDAKNVADFILEDTPELGGRPTIINVFYIGLLEDKESN